jgi:hypothetical protein
MNKIASLPTMAAALLACGLSGAPAQAGPTRTWVSGMGTHSGACTRAASCRTFALALTQTAAGGEIDVLDPAGYGAVTINKSISIVNDGVGVAAIGASSGNAITITAGASDSVHLRGLTIEGKGSGLNGIQFDTGGNLQIENCVIRNFGNGIVVGPTTSSSFFVSNTIAANNVSSGIAILPTHWAVVTGVLGKVSAANNFFGILVDSTGIFVGRASTPGGSLNVTIVDSAASNNANTGVITSSGSGGAATVVMLRNVVASNNGVGLFTRSSATLRVAHSVVTGNNTGVQSDGGGILDSYGDNDIDGNTNNNTGVLTRLAMH